MTAQDTNQQARGKISRHAPEMTDFDRHVLGQYYGYLRRRFGFDIMLRGVRRIVARIPNARKMDLVHRRWQGLVECGEIVPRKGAVS